jgi:hypothetical protein
MFQIIQAINVTGQPLHCIVLSRSNHLMFLAAHNGSVLSVRYPLEEPVDYIDYNMHNHPITRVSCTPHACEASSISGMGLTAPSLETTAVWDVMLCSFVDGYQCCLDLQHIFTLAP